MQPVKVLVQVFAEGYYMYRERLSVASPDASPDAVDLSKERRGQESILTLSMKVVLLPYILHKLIVKLRIHKEVETIVNVPTTMLMGIVLVIFSYHLTAPIRELSTLVTRSTLAVALATVMLGFLMMITRKHAVTQIIGFLAMENGLLFAATSATYGMPLVVELGVALDLLIAAFIFGMFFFHISTTFDSLDVDQMARLKEED